MNTVNQKFSTENEILLFHAKIFNRIYKSFSKLKILQNLDEIDKIFMVVF